MPMDGARMQPSERKYPPSAPKITYAKVLPMRSSNMPTIRLVTPPVNNLDESVKIWNRIEKLT